MIGAARFLCGGIEEGIEKSNFVSENLTARCFGWLALDAEIVQRSAIEQDALLLRQEMLI